jgi:hypothetical protein
LPYARDLLDHRQTRYAVRALSADGDHPTHRLLFPNFPVGELYGYEYDTAHPPSICWTRPEKMHRLSGSRLPQQVVKHVKYDAEHGFDLPCRQDPPESVLVINTREHSRLPVRMLPGHPQQTTLFVKNSERCGVRRRSGIKSAR